MIYNSVAEIYEANDRARARLFRSVEGLGESEQTSRPAPECWSVAEILEHVSLVETGVVRLLRAVLRKADSAGGSDRPAGEPFAPVSVKEFVEQAATRKYTAPEAAVPSGSLAVSDSLARLEEARAALDALRPLAERLDCTRMLYPHPAFGPLNLYQWLAFVGIHQSRHRQQIEAVRETLNAPATAN
jgi:uncharacterized damage-inducible protein DinB